MNRLSNSRRQDDDDTFVKKRAARGPMEARCGWRDLMCEKRVIMEFNNF